MLYGKKFHDQWGAVEPAEMAKFWATELAGYSGAEIKRGVSAMESKDWPPSLPEFKRLCRPPVDALVAYYEAVAGAQARNAGEMGAWSHPAIFWAAMPLSFDLGSMTYSAIKGRWEAALAEQMERGEWAPIPTPSDRLALPAPGQGYLSNEQAAQRLAELGAVKAMTPKHDHRAWIKRIDERVRLGDKSVPTISVWFANEARGTPAGA